MSTLTEQNAVRSSCTLSAVTFAEALESIFYLSALLSFKNRCEFLSYVEVPGRTQQYFSVGLQFVTQGYVKFQYWEIAVYFSKIILFAKSQLPLGIEKE